MVEQDSSYFSTIERARSLYPDWVLYYEKGITKLSSVKLPGGVDGVRLFGDELMGYFRGLGEVGPYKAFPFSNYVADFEVERERWKSLSQRRSLKHPFGTWDEFVDRIDSRWKESGLCTDTIFPVTQEVLSYHGLKGNETLRYLVVVHFQIRMVFDISDLDWMVEHFSGLLRRKNQADDSGIKLIRYVADNSTEMFGKRKIDNQSVPWEDPPLFIKETFATRELRHLSENWRQFMRSAEGQRLGIYSTVYWWLSKGGAERPPSIDEMRTMVGAALLNYTSVPGYQTFSRYPKNVITDAFNTFLGKTHDLAS